MKVEHRYELSDKPTWLMTPEDDGRDDLVFALRCAESFAARLIAPHSAQARGRSHDGKERSDS